MGQIYLRMENQKPGAYCALVREEVVDKGGGF